MIRRGPPSDAASQPFHLTNLQPSFQGHPLQLLLMSWDDCIWSNMPSHPADKEQVHVAI